MEKAPRASNLEGPAPQIMLGLYAATYYTLWFTYYTFMVYHLC
jgi:hypothetical protein